MVLLFANPCTSYIPQIARSYAYPYFQQKWNMFVPPPSSNYNLFVEFECGGLQKYDLFQKVLITHQKNRFNGSEPILLALSNTIHYFEHHTKQRQKLNGPVKNEKFFVMLEHSVLNLLRSTHKCNIEQVKIILLVKEHSGRQRVYFN
jgi:hypothetical protein